MFKLFTFFAIFALAITMVGSAGAQVPTMEVDEEFFPTDEDTAPVPGDMDVETEDDFMDETIEIEDDPTIVPDDETIEVEGEPEIMIDDEFEEEEFEEEEMDAGSIAMVVIAILVIGGVVFYVLRSEK